MPAKRMEKEGKEILSPKPYFIRASEIDLETQEAELVRLKLENEKLKLELDEERRSARRRAIFLYIFLGIYTGLTLVALAIIFADGAGLLDIDTTTINLLIGATIAEAAVLFAVGIRWLFGGKGS